MPKKGLQVLLVLLALSLHVLAGPGSGPDLKGTDFLKSVWGKSPTLGPVAATENKVAFVSGGLTLELEPGLCADIKLGDQVVGLFYKGTAKVRYFIPNTENKEVPRYNVKANSWAKVLDRPDGLEVVDEVKTLALYGDFRKPGLSATAPEGDLSTAFTLHQKLFASRRKDLPESLLLQRAGIAPDAAMVMAELDGPGGKYLFLRDEGVSFKETFDILSFQEMPGVRELNQASVGEIFLKGNRRDPLPPDYVLSHVDLDIQASKGTLATIHVKENVTPLRPGVSLLVFNQDHYTLGHTGGLLERKPIRVDKVSDEAGRVLPYVHLGNQLLVALPEATVLQKPQILQFDLGGHVLDLHGNDNYWELGVRNWFPLPELSGQLYTVRCRLAVEKPFVPVVPGKVIKEESTDKVNIMEAVFEKPVCFFSVAAGNFEIRTYKDPRSPVTLRLCGYSGLSKGGSERLSKTIHGLLQFYSVLLGPSPFDDLVVINRNELGHGQAPPGMVFLTNEAFNPKADLITSMYASAWINAGIAHELAHQYWGHVVKMRSLDDQWITESFSEYCSAIAMSRAKSNGRDRFEKQFNRWVGPAKEASPIVPIALANKLVPASSRQDEWRYRTALVYSKGAMLLASLNKALGEDAFIDFLQTYQRARAWQTSVTQDIPTILKQRYNKDFQDFFERYYWGLEMPDTKP